MPYASNAQRRYFHAAKARGDIAGKTVHEFDEASKGETLPEHVRMADGGEVCPHCLGSGYAEGGEVDAEMGQKKEFDLPDMNLDVYRGEDVPRGPPAEEEEPEEGDDEEKKRRFVEALRRRRAVTGG